MSEQRPSVWVIVVAGGSGARFGGPKQYVEIAGKRVLDWSIAAAQSVADGVVLVVPADDVGRAEPTVDTVVAGGATRAASVRAGLAAVPPDADVIAVHDAARPAAPPALFRAVVDAVVGGADGAVPGVDVADSLRWRDGGALDRAAVVAVQTPQAFAGDALRSAHASGAEASDDATLVELDGGSIVVVDGTPANLKLTHPGDLATLASTLQEGIA